MIAFLNDTVNDNEHKYLGAYREVLINQIYLYLLGHFEKNKYICVHMDIRLRKLYLKNYNRIASLFRE